MFIRNQGKNQSEFPDEMFAFVEVLEKLKASFELMNNGLNKR